MNGYTERPDCGQRAHRQGSDDLPKRYYCSEAACIGRYWPTWDELMRHVRLEHALAHWWVRPR